MSKGGDTVNTNYEDLLKKQWEDLRVIQEKILRLDPENPSQELLEALYLELGRALNEISALKTKQEEMEQCLKENKQLQKEKEALQEDIDEVQEKKQHLLSLLKFRDFESVQLIEDLTQLTEWMGQVEKNFKLFLKSRSWRLGSTIVGTANRLRFKKKKQLSADQILNIFSDFKEWQKRSLEADQEAIEIPTVDEDYELLTEWLRKLTKKTGLLLKSRRWKLVSFLGKYVFGPLGKGKKPRQIKKINAILSDFENMSLKNKKDDITTLCRKIESYEHHYRSLINSERWKISDAVISTANLFLFRKQEKLATTAIEDILAQFRKWRYENKEKYNL